MLAISGYAGYKYLIVAAAVSVWWLGMALSGYKTTNDRVWARKLFVFSIVAITSLSVMMSVDRASPVMFCWPTVVNTHCNNKMAGLPCHFVFSKTTNLIRMWCLSFEVIP